MLICTFSVKAVPSVNALRRHLTLHVNNKEVPATCVTRDSAREIHTNGHLGLKLYKCTKCDKGFQNFYNKLALDRNVHKLAKYS